MSKKIFAASVAAAAVALSACSKDSAVESPANAPDGSAVIPVDPKVSAPELPSPASEYEVLEFDQPYSIGENQASFKGKILLENGIVKSVEVSDAQGPQAVFAEGIAEAVYGRPVKDLQIDTISGASLTTAAFNEFLKTVK